jgi:hypothetical protein
MVLISSYLIPLFRSISRSVRSPWPARMMFRYFGCAGDCGTLVSFSSGMCRSSRISLLTLFMSTCSEAPKWKFRALWDNILWPPTTKFRVSSVPAGFFEVMLRVSNTEIPISLSSLYDLLHGLSFLGSRSKETSTASHRGLCRRSPRIDRTYSKPSGGKLIPEAHPDFEFLGASGGAKIMFEDGGRVRVMALCFSFPSPLVELSMAWYWRIRDLKVKDSWMRRPRRTRVN